MEIRNLINENKKIFFVITALVIGLTIILSLSSFRYSPKVIKPDQATIDAAMELPSAGSQIGAPGQQALAPTQIPTIANPAITNGSSKTETGTNPFLVLIVIVLLIVLSGGVIFFLMGSGPEIKKVSMSEKPREETSSINDQKRQADLARLKNIVEGFARVQKRYPDESEFKTLYTHMDNPPHDPQEGETVPGNGQPPFYQYGYYYTQKREDGKTNDPNFYRLWAFLENGQLYQLTSEGRTPSPAAPVAATATSGPIAAPTPPVPSPVISTTPPQRPLAGANSAWPQIYFSPTINNYQPPQSNSSTSFFIIFMTVVNAALLIANLYIVFLQK